MYDQTLPSSLKELQHWFGEIIGRAIDEDNQIHQTAPSGKSIEIEAEKFILPSKTLKAWERLQIYNQQYWWRLISILQDNLPLVTRMFGYHDFNQVIAIPYLEKHPPNTWSLNPLGTRAPQWILEEYLEEDKELIYNAARIDTAFNDSFVVKEEEAVVWENNLLDIPLKLQPHINLFHLPYNLFAFRKEILKEEPDYWEENDFPKLDHGDFYFIHFRRLNNHLDWQAISKGEYLLLSLFNEGCTVNQACDELEKQDVSIRSEAVKNLTDWFQEWAENRWLYRQP